MRKKITISTIITLSIIIAGLLYIFTYVPDLSDQYGIVESKLYLGNAVKQPLVVAFGGGDGGNDWTRNYLKGKRDSLNQKGYALLAIGYFKSSGTSRHLDRISLNAIRDTILAVAQHPKIDSSKIVLMGGSRGGELVLNLACRYPEFSGVIAMSAPHVSFPAITWTANTSSWMYNDKEVPYVPAPFETISPALKGDLYTAHAMMLEDKEAAKKAEIQVENINGAILILSGKNDELWPASEMSSQIINRLRENDFKHYYQHIQLDGGHIAPLEHFDLVYDFLERHFKIE
ncbi:prolyl oligopeptidase family serine peptidase [Muricauda sp. JGD-17]|uniref:Prolyl oligopeptidase family serine peptidase n=1 Tax=Flagellimonas ochracea TaxID=2696472 RepID=A0A964TBC3_9FLAO|nr:acyl-CoA thioester hydrolase/BAAT C-terminal domain-containing protein [Allomuricauda ochracea]NAY91729.1 prolyl oligopeptidase family serine peptidase [Allomuricauda ochracea]